MLYSVAAGVSAFLLLATWRQWIAFDLVEMFGFVSGGWTVWLTVEENIWNWPIGIVNSVFFLILFLHARLYADSGLQVIYIVLGFLGWYWWLHGGEQKDALKVGHVSLKTGIALVPITMVCTWVMTRYLQSVQDVAPFLDALTTVLSLVAQYLLTKKYIENWYVWISADIVYVGLYGYKNLYLTACLYFVFLCMCIRGVFEWRRAFKKQNSVADTRYVQI